MTTNSASFADIRALVQENADLVLGKFAKELSLSKQASVDATIEYISKFVDLRIEHVEGGKLRGLICLSKSNWDSKHFDMAIGKISHTIFDPAMETSQRLRMFKRLRTESKGMGFRMIFGRLPLKDIRSVHAAEGGGARLMDILLTMRHETLNELGFGRDRTIDTATTDDLPHLQSIAAKVFSIDQFHANEFLDYERSSRLYSEWVSNSMTGSKGTILVVRDKERPIGFILCRLHTIVPGHVVGVIDLVGSHPESMGQGVGSALVSGALEWFSSRVKSVYVGTQAANSPAIRLYERFAFRNIFAEATYHLRT